MPYSKLPSFTALALSRYRPLPTLVHLELNAPKTFNALSPTLFRDWTRALRWAAETDDVHAVVVSGRGRPGSTPDRRVFCAGMAMDESMLEARSGSDSSADDSDTSNLAGDLVEELIRFPKCLAAAINGHAFGLAVTILPLHDLVFALPGRTFKTPFAELGVCAEGCSSVTFPRILGPALTTKMMMLSEPQTAETLASRGFLSVVPDASPDSLPEYALSYIAERFGIPECAADADTVVESADYTNLSLESMMATKRLLRSDEELARLRAANAREMEELGRIAASPVFLTGVSRFLAKQQAKKAAAQQARL